MGHRVCEVPAAALNDVARELNLPVMYRGVTFIMCSAPWDSKGVSPVLSEGEHVQPGARGEHVQPGLPGQSERQPCERERGEGARARWTQDKPARAPAAGAMAQRVEMLGARGGRGGQRRVLMFVRSPQLAVDLVAGARGVARAAARAGVTARSWELKVQARAFRHQPARQNRRVWQVRTLAAVSVLGGPAACGRQGSRPPSSLASRWVRGRSGRHLSGPALGRAPGQSRFLPRLLLGSRANGPGTASPVTGDLGTGCVCQRRAPDVPLGLEVCGDDGHPGLTVRAVRPGGAVEAWNRQMPAGDRREVRVGDHIVKVNDAQDAKDMRDECVRATLLRTIVVVHPAAEPTACFI
ncbi:unnamed protein product [Prorocentrum cordatum]|uniref:PDZ domain-containing protein n=1 Tax=Prorocentrum cordatum TaxID=2364126 RepID=A0ABN9UEL7_9DINO|nr:unnamed protein product [Polarella glacialis]